MTAVGRLQHPQVVYQLLQLVAGGQLDECRQRRAAQALSQSLEAEDVADLCALPARGNTVDALPTDGPP